MPFESIERKILGLGKEKTEGVKEEVKIPLGQFLKYLPVILREEIRLFLKEKGEILAEKMGIKKGIEVRGEFLKYFPDLPPKEAKKFLRRVCNFLFPEEILGRNIKGIRLYDMEVRMPKGFGMEGYMGGSYVPVTQEINFFDPNAELAIILAHEGGHSMDPRVIKQEDLSEEEAEKMIKEWEEVRRKEPEFSPYVSEIKNPDKKEEDLLKSQEDFAETIAFFLTSPRALKEIAPERYEFCERWFEKRFPSWSEKRMSKHKVEKQEVE
jgi:hypothetical protein